MLTEAPISSNILRAEKRLALVRDAAFNLFNPKSVKRMPIQSIWRPIACGPVAGVVDVNP